MPMTGTPSTSLHIDDGAPWFVLTEERKIQVWSSSFYGHYLNRMSELKTDDRVMSIYGHIELSENVKDLYKACSRALEAKMFCLEGRFDCANNFIRAGMSSRQFWSLPSIIADRWFPYHFKHSSPIQGSLRYERVLPPSHNDSPYRLIRCIEVRRYGHLTHDIPHRVIVYLGGNHNKKYFPNGFMKSDNDDEKVVDCKNSLGGTREMHFTAPNHTRSAIQSGSSQTCEDDTQATGDVSDEEAGDCRSEGNSCDGRDQSEGKRECEEEEEDDDDEYSILPEHDTLSMRTVYISSPFTHSWRSLCGGPNVGFAKLRNGHFLYWSTPKIPDSGQQISDLSCLDVPRAHAIASGVLRTMLSCQQLPENSKKCTFWPPEVEDESVIQAMIEGAWVIRGNRLTENVDANEYPPGVLERLQGGFFRAELPVIDSDIWRIARRAKKAIQSIQRIGAKTFGFEDRREGLIGCKLSDIARHLRVDEQGLLGFMALYGSVEMLFSGSIGFLCIKDMNGPLEIMDPVPVGEWMRGSLYDTGAGLLYMEKSQRYFSVETIGEVSWLSDYTGPGIGEVRKLKLGRFLAYAR